MPLIECVPNFSEGRRPEVIAAIRDAIASVDGVVMLDVSSDASHNRSVVTFVAPLENAVRAAFAGVKEAAARIDLTTHEGKHPRIGATDVVPFVPLEGATMDDCVALAKSLGARVAGELGIPVYLYERAASVPTRENLADVRRGEFEGLRTDIEDNPSRHPDFGPAMVHPTAGATAIGARPFLVAYNIYLGGAEHLAVAKQVARAVRQSSGGLPHVKALGLEVDGQAQVSMNLVDTESTSIARVFDTVKAEAEALGVSPTWSEIVGLVPERALLDTAAHHLLLRDFSLDRVLEHKVRQADGRGRRPFVDDVAAATPAPGGGSVAAHVGSLGAALAQMVTGLTIGRKKYAAVEADLRALALRASALGHHLTALVERDAAAYGAVMLAYTRPKDTPAAIEARTAAIDEALLGAAAIPLETARACAEVAGLAETLAAKGNTNCLSDSGVAALIAEAACRGAVYNVQINVGALSVRSDGASLVAEATALLATARLAAESTHRMVQAAIAG